MRRILSFGACLGGCLAALAPALAVRRAGAQERLLGAWTTSTGVVVEHWSLPTAAEVRSVTGDAMYVAGTTQITLPAAVVVPLGHGWFADAYGAYTTNLVRLARPTQSGETRLLLRGGADSRARLVGHLLGDHLTVTGGVTAPTGRTHLGGTEMDALSVVSAPGLGLRTPGLGSGFAATVGAVYGTQLGTWGIAAGASYEHRGAYTPSSALEAGLAAGSFRAGGVARVSLGLDHTMGAFRHTLNVSADVPQTGSLELDLPGGGGVTADVRTAPVLTGLYELDAVRGRARTSLFASARTRGQYETSGVTVHGSDRVELEGGAEEAVLVTATRTLRLAADARYQTRSAGQPPGAVTGGLVGFSTSAAEAAGATLGLRMENGTHTFGAEPFVHGQLARLDFGAGWQAATEIGGGLTLSLRF